MPEVLEGAAFYWAAFGELTSERSFGMGVGPIPYSAIRAYADEYDMRSRDEFTFFLGIIQALDSEYIALANKTDKDKTEMVPVDDIEQQHLLFDRLRARATRKK
jgi:hypothetical protein